MENYLNQTGVPKKGPGDGLSHKDVNAINSTLNKAVDAINRLVISDECNVNLESGNVDQNFVDLMDAIDLVPQGRRKPGIKVIYRDPVGNWVERIWKGGDWTDYNNWSSPVDDIVEIDGGTW